jgi:hypothetical protein
MITELKDRLRARGLHGPESDEHERENQLRDAKPEKAKRATGHDDSCDGLFL